MSFWIGLWMLWQERVTTEEVQAMGRVAWVGGRSAGCLGDRARGKSTMIGGTERMVGNGEVRVMGWGSRGSSAGHEAGRL